MRPLEREIGTTLAGRVRAADSARQRLAALAGAQAAVAATALVDALIEEAFGCLCEENYSAGLQQAVAAVVEWLDGQAWDLRDAAGESPAPPEYHAAFKRARAAAAVGQCFEREPLLAVNEALYEAAHAIEGDARLGAVIEGTLDLLTPRNGWNARVLGKLFWPTFDEHDGYVLLADQYTPANLASWVERHPDRPEAIEDVINHVHLEDLAADNTAAEAITRTAKQLREAWALELRRQFPERPYEVSLNGTILSAFRQS
jgi:hypothetical protein